jgi:hypothetical protein
MTCIPRRLDMSEENKSAQKQSHFGALLLATILSVVGSCAVGESVALQNLFTRRFPSNGSFNVNFNVTRPFNATRTFTGQVVAQRVSADFACASWLELLGLACLIIVAIILTVLLLGSKSYSSAKTQSR